MSSQVVKVKIEKILSCMTCPLCNNLLNQATTISLCLHTFCRKCIYDRFSDDENDTCPVCDINLGCVPVEKLRPDHNLQDIRTKIFPLKRRKVESLEVLPSSSPPAKRKKRSLSSLVTTPKVSTQAGVTGRRTRAGRKDSVPSGANPSIEGTPKKEEDSEDRMEASSSPETLNKIMQNKKQSSTAKPSTEQPCGENKENNQEGWEGKADLWKPLNTLVEAANRTKLSNKAGLQGPTHDKPDESSSKNADVCMKKVKVEDNNGLRNGSQDDKSNMPCIPGPVQRKRMRTSNKKPTSGLVDSSTSQVLLKSTRRNWKKGPIWFSLVASADPEVGEPLPQVSAAFLCVRDGNMPVSSIQKYLVQKLGLSSELEVQLTCQGQPVIPHLKLSSLVDLWIHSLSAEKVRSLVGDSAKECVMVLSYSRKVLHPVS